MMLKVKRPLLFTCIGLFIMIVFYPAIESYFVTDDMRLIYISSPLTVKNLSEIFTSSGGWFAGFYRPLARLAFFTDYTLYNLDPRGYHLTNLIFHLASTLVVFFFARMLIGNEKAAIFASLIFAVQPLHTEAVTWISGRNDLMFTFFYLLSIVSFLGFVSRDRKRRTFLILSVICFSFALLSKESAVTLPVIIFMTGWLFLRNKDENLNKEIKYIHYLPFIVVLVLFLIIKTFIMGKGIYAAKDWASSLLGTAYFFLQLFAPINIDTFKLGDMFGLMLNILILMTFIAMLVLYLLYTKNKVFPLPFFIYCCLWIIITSFPVYFISGARFLYISSVASSILMGFILTEIWVSNNRMSKTLATLLITVIMVISSVRTVQRNKIYTYAGNIAEGILSQLYEKHPYFILGSVLYFINFPHGWVRSTEAWVKPIPVMAMAVRVKYSDTSLVVYSGIKNLSTVQEKLQFLQRNSLEKYIKAGKNCYVFEYENGNVIDTTDALIVESITRKEILLTGRSH